MSQLDEHVALWITNSNWAEAQAAGWRWAANCPEFTDEKAHEETWPVVEQLQKAHGKENVCAGNPWRSSSGGPVHPVGFFKGYIGIYYRSEAT